MGNASRIGADGATLGFISDSVDDIPAISGIRPIARRYSFASRQVGSSNRSADHSAGLLERVSSLWKRNTLSILHLAHVLVGEPASTSPEHALAR